MLSSLAQVWEAERPQGQRATGRLLWEPQAGGDVYRGTGDLRGKTVGFTSKLQKVVESPPTGMYPAFPGLESKGW